jgi:hypothetical protein
MNPPFRHILIIQSESLASPKNKCDAILAGYLTISVPRVACKTQFVKYGRNISKKGRNTQEKKHSGKAKVASLLNTDDENCPKLIHPTVTLCMLPDIERVKHTQILSKCQAFF